MYKWIFALLLLPVFHVSASDSFTEKLIQSCRKAVSLFGSSTSERQTTMQLTINQSFATSNSDAIQIGYCRGVIDALMQMSPHCRYDHWFQIAERIIEEDTSQTNSVELIQNAC